MKNIKKNTVRNDDIYHQAIQVATEDVDAMSDFEVAEYLSIDEDEVDYEYRYDAIDKRTEELLILWEKL